MARGGGCGLRSCLRAPGAIASAYARGHHFRMLCVFSCVAVLAIGVNYAATFVKTAVFLLAPTSDSFPLGRTAHALHNKTTTCLNKLRVP